MAATSWIRSHLAQRQHRNAYALLLNNVLAAATGLLFWLLFAHTLPADEVGVGYAVVGLGTLVGVVAKGGLDTALLRAIPGRDRRTAEGVYRFAVAVGAAVALALAFALALASLAFPLLPSAGPFTWALVAAIAVLLVATWLQDARFLAHGDAGPSLKRNLVLSAARIVLPVAAVAWAVARPVPLSLACALALSLLAGTWLARRLPADTAQTRAPLSRRAFLATALRNAASSAAEFLPGLLLAPLVLAVAGAEAAAYFGIAWTAASLLFLASSALARSALAEMLHQPGSQASSLRRGVAQHAVLVLPAALACGMLAPTWLSFFGMAYARAAASTLGLLATSVLFVAPGNLYLAVLRARDSPFALAAYPLAMVALLVALAPTLLHLWGLPGVALAWLAANIPLGIAGIVALSRILTAPSTQTSTVATLPEAAEPAAGGTP